MTDYAAMCGAIRLQPDDDTPRLIFADLLDELNESDWDRATAEFIRLSCKGSKKMPSEAAEWLKVNWKRLIPNTVALHQADTEMKFDAGYSPEPFLKEIKGSLIICKIGLRPLDRPKRGQIYTCTVSFRFRRGFCVESKMYSKFAGEIIEPVLKAEAPLLESFIVGRMD